MTQKADNKSLMCDQHKFNMDQVLVESKHSTDHALRITQTKNQRQQKKEDISHTDNMVELGEQA